MLTFAHVIFLTLFDNILYCQIYITYGKRAIGVTCTYMLIVILWANMSCKFHHFSYCMWLVLHYFSCYMLTSDITDLNFVLFQGWATGRPTGISIMKTDFLRSEYSKVQYLS